MHLNPMEDASIHGAAAEDKAGALDGRKFVGTVRIAMWCVTALAGLLHAWAERFWLSPDAINYLDIASAYLRQDWKNAVNAYWSPFFSWILAAALYVVRPKADWEATLLHVVNFVGLLLSLAAFEFFFRSLLRLKNQFGWKTSSEDGFPEYGYWTLGYGVFLSTSLFVLTVPSTTTPDVWLCVFSFLAMGLMLRIWESGGGSGRFAALGAALGCAYLTKAIFFPLSFMILGFAWLSCGASIRHLRQAMVGVVAFCVLAVPWIAAISKAKGRVTFGDVGKIAYAITAGGVVQPAFWQGENGTGIPKHPTRLLLDSPRIYEYALPVGGTYPAGYDWSYWMDGVKPRVSLRGHLRVLRQSVGTIYAILLTQVEYAMAVAIFLFLPGRKLLALAGMRRQSFVWIVPLTACCLYALLLVEGRYVAPFLPFLWISMLTSCLGAMPASGRSVCMAVVLATISMTLLRTAKFMEADLVAILAHPENVDAEVAKGLEAMGVRAGDKVSLLANSTEVEWARQAKITIVSEIPFGAGGEFWTADAGTKQKVFEILRNTGAKVLVTKDPPLTVAKEEWVPLGHTDFYTRALP